MCGFIGLLNEEGQAKQYNRKVQEGNHIIYHRGPDDEGYYDDAYVSFGFSRLSIIDLDSGHQPFSYGNERYWLMFNGEIYNYIELRKMLIEKGYIFFTDSDTEVVIAMFKEYGVEAFKQLRGMFAIIIWDKEEKLLYGARDPFGIKPFYYAERENNLYFSSEKKSLGFLSDEKVDHRALQHYLSFQYVPEPYTMSEDIFRLEPGTFFQKKVGEKIQISTYWKASFQPGNSDSLSLTKEIRDTLDASVQKHMRSDVPVGSFLSGGIDSSFIVALAKRYNPNIKTFSVGFSHEGYSEVDLAKETADKLGVENYSTIISAEQFVEALPEVMWHMDDPLADPACIPLYFVAKEAKKQVKVVLSGEGADELFGGYNIYREPESLKMFNYLPEKLNGLIGQLAKILPEGVKGKSFLERGTTPLSNRYIGNAKMFAEKEKESFFSRYSSGTKYQDITDPFYEQAKAQHPVNQMQYIDLQTWLRGDILLKADKMTMAHSLELRVPFLDVDVFNVANRIPVDLKIANGTTKYLLRSAAKGIVPEAVLNRKKLGFPVPIRLWLKNELYSWAVNLIHESDTSDILNKTFILKLLEEHRIGKNDYSRKIWTVLMFMLWHQIFIEHKYDHTNFNKVTKSELNVIPEIS
ncbi:asparagine synthase (glutamine-hydrolyzing) [Saliterribacillus persicus]|uniref:asparagine synthase (glutamine-hydrolyzing) n=1 Tax=Saliterribacillus persicus TaxID=930114 RepID=A0A368XFZ8_9BACI|nr:asparagine synthase (glutamine-hydrolyzing) [Saliterribacillus persicus]RCW66910.1 asparagine synthase (glutamine-hydrolysing) [Saliterribacillus persicus]